jgi:hypothetical protein
VRFIGVDIRDDRAAALAFEHEYAVPCPSVYDRDDSAAAGFAPWPPAGTPTTCVSDTHGRIAAAFSGRTIHRPATCRRADRRTRLTHHVSVPGA